MDSIDGLVDTIDSEIHGWDKLFREIKVTSASYDLTCRVAKLQANRTRNRYGDVSPYDHSRVKLQNGQNDYVNSSLVKVEAAGRAYILSQGPLPATSGHFWQMVWEQNSKAVIMLNKIIEKGVRKCHQYWPIDSKREMTFVDDGYEIAFVGENKETNFVIRELLLTNLKTNASRTVHQFHYIAWPDFGVPESPTAFLDFLTCVRNYGVLEDKNSPAVIHCSAGIGRSGTFALVDTCYVFLQRGIPFDIRDTLLEMRKYRMGLIQTAKQLRFSYLAIAECSRMLNAQVDDKSDLSEDDDSHQSERDSDSDSERDESDKAHQNGDGKINTSDNRKRHAEDPPGSQNEKRGKEEDSSEQIPETMTPSSEAVNSSDATVLRQRQRELKKATLSQKVEEIKKNMHASEKRIDWKKYIIGGVLASVVIGLAVRYWYG